MRNGGAFLNEMTGIGFGADHFAGFCDRDARRGIRGDWNAAQKFFLRGFQDVIFPEWIGHQWFVIGTIGN
jgi:hypothetical protein